MGPVLLRFRRVVRWEGVGLDLRRCGDGVRAVLEVEVVVHWCEGVDLGRSCRIDH